MIKMYGSGLVATWRPHEEGGSGGAHIRASEKHCDHVVIYGDTVLMQYHDGFWESGSMTWCSITWSDKPEVYLVDEATGRETPVDIKGNVNTIADNLKFVLRKPGGFVPMSGTNENIEGALVPSDLAGRPSEEEESVEDSPV